MTSELPQDNRWAKAGRIFIAAGLIAVVLALYPGTPEPAFHIKTVIAAMTSCLAIACAFMAGRNATDPRAISPLTFFLAAFLAMAALSAFWSGYRGFSLNQLAHFVSVTAIFFAARDLYRSAAELRSIFATVALAVFLSSCYAFLQKAGLDPFPWSEAVKELEEYKNLPATYGNPNLAGHALVLAIPLTLCMAALPRWRWMILPAAAMGLHLVWTQQRAGLIALAAAAVLALCTAAVRRVSSKPNPAMLGALFATALLLAASAAAVISYSNMKWNTPLPPDPSLALRYNAVQGAASMVAQHPWSGWGFGAFALHNPPFWTSFEQQWFAAYARFNEHVHCEPVEFAVEMGWPGASLYFGVLIAALLSGIRTCLVYKDDRRTLGLAFAAMAMAFAVDGLFGFNMHAPASAFMFFAVAGAFDGVAAQSAQPRRWTRAIPVAAVCAVAFALVQEIQFFRSARLLKSGMDWAAAGEPLRAAPRLVQSERIAPWNWVAPFERGRILASVSEFRDAEAAFQKALANNPNYVLAFSSLGSMQFTLAGRMQPGTPNHAAALAAAQANCASAIELCNALPDAHEILAKIALLAETQPTDLPTTFNFDRLPKANLEMARDHLTTAIAGYEIPAPSLYALLGDVLIHLDDKAAAESLLLRLIEVEPESAARWDLFADYARRMQRPEALRFALDYYIAYYRGVQAGNPSPQWPALLSRLYTHSGAMHEIAGDHNSLAYADYRRAAALDPANAAAWHAYSDFVRAHGYNYAFTQQLADPVPEDRQLPPAAALLRDMPAMGEAALPDAARELADQALIYVNQNGISAAAPLVKSNLAWAADWLLDVQQNMNPNDAAAPQAAIDLATVYALAGRPEDALPLFEQWNAMLPQDRQFGAWRFWHTALMQAGRADDATALLETCLQRNPADMDVQLALARTYASAGRKSDALAAYNAMLATPDLDPMIRAAAERERSAVDRMP